MALSAPVPAAASDFERLVKPLTSDCEAIPPLLELRGRLDRTIELIRTVKPIEILAIGSSSTFGLGASRLDYAYPERLKVELGDRLPQGEFTVVKAGKNGERILGMLPRMRRLVRQFEPDLVIWQTGLNDALGGVEPERFEALLREGVTWLRERGVDVMLMDMQYYPEVRQPERLEAFAAIIDRVAADLSVPVFPRHALMRHWSDRTGVVGANMLARDAFHMNDLGYRCIAEVLAESIVLRALSPIDPGRAGAEAAAAPDG